jgi:hypothetical protein
VEARLTGVAAEDLDLSHPAFADVRALLGGLDELNLRAERADLRTESGVPVRFVRPEASDPGYELEVHRSGRVQTRPGSLHDLFNALVWLAFPRTKARINALHAARIPHEGGRRGRLRDMLTLFDEGGAIVGCADPALIDMVRAHRWRELFWDNRRDVLAGMRIRVLGHAVLEKALAPYPGITCKALFVAPGADADAQAAAWLASRADAGSPRDLAALPVFGYPGWLAESGRAEFYDDARWFRPAREARRA